MLGTGSLVKLSLFLWALYWKESFFSSYDTTVRLSEGIQRNCLIKAEFVCAYSAVSLVCQGRACNFNRNISSS